MRILLVDDDEDIRFLGGVVASRTEGITVTTAESGEEGLRLARSGSPDVILLDVFLGDMEGREVLEHLRREESTRGIPVVFLTGASGGARSELLGLGALGVISKPLQPEILVEEIRAFLEEAPAVPPRDEDRAPGNEGPAGG